MKIYQLPTVLLYELLGFELRNIFIILATAQKIRAQLAARVDILHTQIEELQLISATSSIRGLDFNSTLMYIQNLR
jgi:hypothetical protein